MESPPPPPAPSDLAGVRSELKRLGYLSHGFERYLLQDALRPERPWRTLLDLTAKVALLGGAGIALVLAFALCAANGSLTTTPLDLLALFLHLFPPIALAAAAGFLGLSGVVILVLKLYHVRRIETLALAAAVAAGAFGLGLALWRGRELVAGSPRWQLAVVAVAAPLAVYVMIKLVYHGLLALAIRLTDAPPDRRLFSRRGLGFGILSAAFLLTLPAVLAAARGERVEAPPSLPEAPGERVLLLGIDGVLPGEVDYLLKTGDLPVLSRLAGESGGVRAYSRTPEAPASFWASVATGLPTPEHGVAALDSFRPLWVSTPLARTGALRAYWSRIEVPLHLAEYRPVLANRRSAFTVWELAARGGSPVLAVNWWATFPAAPLPGLVIAHGGYQLLREGAAGAVASAGEPSGERAALAGLASAVDRRAGTVDPRLGAALSTSRPPGPPRPRAPPRPLLSPGFRRAAGRRPPRRRPLPAGARHRRRRLPWQRPRLRRPAARRARPGRRAPGARRDRGRRGGDRRGGARPRAAGPGRGGAGDPLAAGGVLRVRAARPRVGGLGAPPCRRSAAERRAAGAPGRVPLAGAAGRPPGLRPAGLRGVGEGRIGGR